MVFSGVMPGLHPSIVVLSACLGVAGRVPHQVVCTVSIIVSYII